jgi:ataxia telangiectasia mutated family protein
MDSFSDLEALTATRISLVRSVRQREERHQIGTIVTPFVASLIDIEKNSLLCLSRAARASNQVQIALNSVVRAQRLTQKPSFEVSEEFANVLWLQKEEKLAVQFLRDIVDNSKNVQSADMSRKAMWLARLVN